MLVAVSNPQTVAEMLLAVREGTGESQQDFAAALEISPQYLCDLEQGRRGPSVDLVERICKHLGRGPVGRLEWHAAAARFHGWDIQPVRNFAPALEELFWLFEDKQDIDNNGGPNDAMRAVQIINAALK